MASITILYPSGYDFNLKYYLETHMPLAERTWKPHGLQSWDITKLATGEAFQIQAVLRFPSLALWDEVTKLETSRAVFRDIPAFTSAQPLVLRGEAIASGKMA
ncbi:hypothetical protein E4U43_004749 [Claviceps pusilla]|uniref:EthD domain-containing protein n=1 Tax=Claviceps pusilla TaxID=123648 RepID=A0A9P7STS3_9HYPO|nr:hypothetical protein E4U43_004749 [Claviceps pusilla]